VRDLLVALVYVEPHDARVAIVVIGVDQDPTDANPYLNPFALDINKGNKQIAHGITAVLRPVDLP